MASKLDVPKFDALMKPTLEALRALGGSASNQELHDWVADHLRLSDEARSVPHGDRGMTALEYRLHWARSYLKRVGAVDNSERGVWTITDIGRQMTEAEIAEVKRRVRLEYAEPTCRQEGGFDRGSGRTRRNRTSLDNAASSSHGGHVSGRFRAFVPASASRERLHPRRGYGALG